MMNGWMAELLARQRQDEALRTAAEQRRARLADRGSQASAWRRFAGLIVAGARARDGGRIAPHAPRAGQMPRL